MAVQLKLTVKNIHEVFKFSKKMKDKKSVEACKIFVRENMHQLLEDEETFLAFDSKFVKIVLKCFSIEDKAMQMFDMLFKWCDKHGKRKVFKYFPWRFVTMNEYANYIRPLSLISDHKFISAFKKKKVKNETKYEVNKFEVSKHEEYEIESGSHDENVNEDDDVIILQEKYCNTRTPTAEMDFEVITLDEDETTMSDNNFHASTDCDENEVYSEDLEPQSCTAECENRATEDEHDATRTDDASQNIATSENGNENNSPNTSNRRQCAMKSTTPKNLSTRSKSALDMCRKSGSSRFNCPICDKEYVQWSRLLRHIQLLHESPQIHDCKICGKQLSTKVILRRHMIGVHKVTPL